MEFIILTDDKQPSHKFKSKNETKSYADVKDFDNYAVVVPDGFVVLDFDTTVDADRMLEIIEAMDLKCRVFKTTRGIHVWFKSSEPMKNFIKSRLAIGLYSDCKSGVNGDKRAYVVLKRDGVKRKVLRHYKDEEIEEIPKWLKPVSAPNNRFKFLDMDEGDGRNQELFNYIVYLQTKGFDRDQIRETIDVINQFVFANPLPDHEIGLIYRDESFKPDEEIEQQTMQSDGFKHNVFGDKLIEEYNIITVNNQLFVYEDGYYQQDERIIERKMIELYPSIRNTQRNEVLSYIRIKTHVNGEDVKVNPYIINVNNTRLDVRTGDLLPFTPDAIEFDRIPVTHDPSAYNADLDKMLNRVFMGDKEVIQLFDEMVGYMLIKHARYRAGFMLFGGGRNGKSTILDLLKRFIGSRNHATIELEKLTDRFSTAELEHKLANIGDDINHVTLKNTGTLKKLFTGESLQVERKGERPFTMQPYAKMIFAMNELPHSYDKSEGFYSRLMFIPFNARFTPEDADFDPNIADKIMTEESLSYLLNRAILGAQRLMKRGGFSRPKSVE
ncbi:phage/plasmid primase, P4 family, partial [Streptococcus mutans]|nr:phage/plasmid primase, P4 family [Streptococcus mutans]